MDSLLRIVNELGIAASEVTVLSDHATTVIAVEGSGLVARIHKPGAGEAPEVGRSILTRGRELGLHLARSEVLATRPHEGAGVLAIDDTWMTLWHREHFRDDVVTGQQLGRSLAELERGVSSFGSELPRLVAWNSAGRLAAERAQSSPDHRLRTIAATFGDLDDAMNHAEFMPAHGDSHPGNLMKVDAGWMWIDLGDAGLMPKHWDLATAITRSVVLGSHIEESQRTLRAYGDLTGRVVTADDLTLPLMVRSVQETLICWDMQDDPELVDLRIENTALALHDPRSTVAQITG